MSKRVSVIVVLVVGSVLACGSDPAPAPATPPANVSVAVTAQATTPAVGATAPTTAPAATQFTAPAADTSNPDVVACLGHIDPKATDACKTCVATSCLPQIKTVGTTCPDFSKCVCDGTKAMTDCAPYLMTPACGQAGSAVGACARQSCAAQCPFHTTTTATTTATAPTTAPGATSGDSCAALSACCAQVPGGAPPSCAQLVGTKNSQACTSLLTLFKNLNKCH